MSDKTDPKHYASLSPQPVEVIEAWGLDWHLGNALKYLARCGRKPGESLIDDCSKAVWYMKRRIALEEARAAAPPEGEGDAAA